jgi:hypothetical protein
MKKLITLVLMFFLYAGTANAHLVLGSGGSGLTQDPAACDPTKFTTDIDQDGTLTCSPIVDADVPNTITIDLATEAGALTVNPTACNSGQFVEDIDADGTLSCATPGGNFGRGAFVICGEATTVNNNTIYYGADIALSANNEGFNCDINAAGGTVEASEDVPVYTNQAFNVASMTCRNENDANANISFTLRNNAGATVPSVTCTIADNERDCVANIQTTTLIAAANPVAVAVASTSDIGPNNGFVCTIQTRFPIP